MASATSSILALKQSLTFHTLHEHQKEAFLEHAKKLGEEAFTCPADDKEFEDDRDSLRRLNAWGFVQGCSFVTTRSHPNDTSPCWWFQCVYYSKVTANRWKLEHRVVKEVVENELKIMSKRRRSSVNMRWDC